LQANEEVNDTLFGRGGDGGVHEEELGAGPAVEDLLQGTCLPFDNLTALPGRL